MVIHQPLTGRVYLENNKIHPTAMLKLHAFARNTEWNFGYSNSKLITKTIKFYESCKEMKLSISSNRCHILLIHCWVCSLLACMHVCLSHGYMKATVYRPVRTELIRDNLTVLELIQCTTTKASNGHKIGDPQRAR